MAKQLQKIKKWENEEVQDERKLQAGRLGGWLCYALTKGRKEGSPPGLQHLVYKKRKYTQDNP